MSESLKKFIRQFTGLLHAAICKLVYGDAKYIFILSHMRGYTSLLSHILGSSIEVAGYKEHHISYAYRGDLLNLRWSLIRDSYKYLLPNRYQMDKILHNHIEISERVLLDKRIYKIFFIRKPEGAIKSILSMLDGWDEARALDYYIDRLKVLEDYALICKQDKRAVFIEADDLIDNTGEVFCCLENFLDLTVKLSEDYNLFPKSGQKTYGDSSQYIKSGKIDRSRKKSDVRLSDETLEKSNLAYDQCKKTIASCLLTVAQCK